MANLADNHKAFADDPTNYIVVDTDESIEYAVADYATVTVEGVLELFRNVPGRLATKVAGFAPHVWNFWYLTDENPEEE